MTAGSFIILDQLVAGSIMVRNINSCIVFAFKSVLPYEVYT